MSNTLGIDVEAAEQLSRMMQDTAQGFTERANTLTSQLDSVQWTGTYANQFRTDWTGSARQNLATIAQLLSDTGTRLYQHAQRQREVSGN